MAARAYKRGEDPVAPPTGDRLFFFSRDLFANLKKKNYTLGLSPMGATGGIFEILQNGHIFLKFLFFLNIKKKKAPN